MAPGRMFQYVIAFLCFAAQFTYNLSNKVCKLPVDNGRCKTFPTECWYFDAKSKTCKQFMFTCGGNGNNFLSRDECIGLCTNICTLSVELGTHSGPGKRYYYFDQKLNECKQSRYASEGGNNMFPSLDKCQRTCMSICTLPHESGLCRAMNQRFYYNYKSHKCQRFIYGGCGGNRNNFEKIQDCENACQNFKFDYSDEQLQKFD